MVLASGNIDIKIVNVKVLIVYKDVAWENSGLLVG